MRLLFQAVHVVNYCLLNFCGTWQYGVKTKTVLEARMKAVNMTELKNSNYNIVLRPSPSRAIISDTRSGVMHSNPPSPWTTELNYSVSAVAQPSPTSAERTNFSKPIKNPTTLDEQVI
ncbi:unnamed protein product [Dibothriocephalus latus]|uniref:Uncharacterized protein n=1 Tax=Dibothriocephalus latus TaxID=60516 RepID=A0A3P7MA50_DIBLA|nr:unnamed protein product [Dibothriocephalus latus]